MRTIMIKVTSDGVAEPITTGARLGYCGEHMSTTMHLQFDSGASLYFSSAEYFRIVINGKYSEKLYNEMGSIYFTIPSDMLIPPAVHCQLVGYSEEDGEPTVISKSSVFELSVGYSQMPHRHAKTTADAYEAALVKCESFADKAKQSSDSAALSADTASQSAETAIIAADTAEASAVQSEIHCNNAAGYSSTAAESAVEAALCADGALKSYNKTLKISEGINQTSNSVLGTVTGGSVTVNDISPIVHEPKIVCSVPSVARESITLNSVDISYNALTLPYPVNRVSATLLSKKNYGWENVELEYNSNIHPIIDGVPFSRGSNTFVLQGEVINELEYKISGTTLSIKATNEFLGDMELEYQVTEGAMITGFIIKDASTSEGAVIPDGVTVIGEPESHVLTLTAKEVATAFSGEASTEPINLPRPVTTAELSLNARFNLNWIEIPTSTGDSKLIPIINGTAFDLAAIRTGINKDFNVLTNLKYTITDTTLTVEGTKDLEQISLSYPVSEGSMITGFIINGINTGEGAELPDYYTPEGTPEIYDMSIFIDKGTMTLVTATAPDGSIQMASADQSGNVYGILSVYPEMTFSVSEGNIAVTYNRDLNKCLHLAMPKDTLSYTSDITLPANRMIIVNTLEGDITISLDDGLLGYDNEWDVTITQGDTAYDIVLPIIEWIGDAPTFEANSVTQVRLFYKGNVLMGVAI